MPMESAHRWVDALFEEPAPLSDATLEDAARDLDLPMSLIERAYAVWSIAPPPRDARLREDDLEMLTIVAEAHEGLGRNEELTVAGIRYFGENLRRIAESQIKWFRSSIEEPLLARGTAAVRLRDDSDWRTSPPSRAESRRRRVPTSSRPLPPGGRDREHRGGARPRGARAGRLEGTAGDRVRRPDRLHVAHGEAGRRLRRRGRGSVRRCGAANHRRGRRQRGQVPRGRGRSEEHTSELQSPCNLVCRLLLEKKKN